MNEKKIVNTIKVLLYGGSGIVAVTILTYVFRGHVSLQDIDNETIGTFGDFVGGFVGTIFTIATAFLVWLTYNSQKKEQQLTTDLNRKQRFEDTFFKLLQAQQDLKNNTTFETLNRLTWFEADNANLNHRKIDGQYVFEFAAEDFSRLYIKRPGLIMPSIISRTDFNNLIAHLLDGEPEEIPMTEPLRRIKQKYKEIFDVYHHQLGHYFRHLYYILKFIKETEDSEIVNGEDEIATKRKYKFYAGVLQAQLSSSELFHLFYNGLCFPKMYELIQNYNLLRNLASEDLADGAHIDLYGANSLKTRRTMLD